MNIRPSPHPDGAVSTDQKLDTFDIKAQPSLNKALVLELTRCEWIEKRQTCIALGSSVSRRAHIGLALGLVASGLNSLIVYPLNGRT
jgi:IstB-like ATP binding protein